VIHISVQN